MAMWNSVNISDVRSGFRIDSEFYRSEYIEKDAELAKLKTLPLCHLAKVTDGEHGSVKFIKNGVKYLTAEHVKQGYIDADTARFVSAEVDRRNARASVCAGDVLISIKGTLGEVGLAEESLLPANMNRDVAIIKPFSNSVIGEFITTFLRSRFGEYQLAREGSGGVQQMITLERLRSVRIPSIGDAATKEVASIYQKGLKSRQESIKIYTQAQQLLESELGLDKLRFEKPVGYTARFSESFTDSRFDADYFQPKYRLIQNTLKKYKHGYQQLSMICKAIKPNIDPSKTPAETFQYIELSNINSSLGMVDGVTSGTGSSLPSRARRRVLSGDILASSVVGSIDKSAIITNAQEGFIASTGFFHLRPTSVSPEYLLMLIRSKAVQLQLQQQATGGILSAVPDSRLKHVLVPTIPKAVQNKITKLVQLAHGKKNEATKLLDQAKSRVEQLIEESVQA